MHKQRAARNKQMNFSNIQQNKKLLKIRKKTLHWRLFKTMKISNKMISNKKISNKMKKNKTIKMMKKRLK